MKIWLAITLLSTALWSVSAAKNVVNIKNSKDFDQTIKKNDMVLVKFNGPKCTTCKKVEPKVEKYAAMLKKDKVLVAEVDCHANKSVCDKHKINSYPTLQVFKAGRPSNIKTRGKRLMIRDVNDVVELHNTDELKKMKEDKPLLAVAYVHEDEDALDAWSSLSEKVDNTVALGIVQDKKSILNAENITSIPSVVLYKHFDNKPDVYEGEIDLAKVEDFIKVNSVPLLASVDHDTFINYVEADRPLVYIFSDSQEMKDQMQDLFLPLAKKYKGFLTFAHINPDEFTEQAEFLNLKDKKWPAVAVHDFKKDVRTAYDQSKSINENSMTEFLEGIKQATVSYEKVSSLEPVTEITSSNYEDIVMDKDRDVLLEIYAPWCGHCRHLAPIYQQLGEFMQVNHADAHGIVIAKMDGTKYSVPESAGFTVTGYPTIKLIKAKDNKAVKFEGQRTLHDFVDFLNRESTKQTLKIDLSHLPEKEEKITMKHVQVEKKNLSEA